MTAELEERIIDVLAGPLEGFARQVAETFGMLPIEADDPDREFFERAERESAEGALREAVARRIEQCIGAGMPEPPSWARERAFERLLAAYAARRKEVRAAPQIEGQA